MNRLKEAQIRQTGVQIKNLAEALELYKLQFHAYPSTAEGLAALVAQEGSTTAATDDARTAAAITATKDVYLQFHRRYTTDAKGKVEAYRAKLKVSFKFEG